MKKPFRNTLLTTHPIASRIGISLLLSSFYFYYLAYDILSHSKLESLQLVIHSSTYIAFYAACIVLTSFVPWLFYVLWTVLCIAGFLSKYALDQYHIPISQELLGILMQSTTEEIDSVLDTVFIVTLLSGLCAGIAGALCMYWIGLRRCNFKTVATSIAVCLGIILALGWHYENRIRILLPFNLVAAIHDYAERTYVTTKAMRNRTNIGLIAGKFIHTPEDPLYVVLVIGESARSDHFSLNGYARETNPKLKKIPNLVSFTNTTACAKWTQVAVPCLLNRAATRGNTKNIYKETSLVSVFKGLGFKTIWLDAQGDLWYLDPQVSVLKEADVSKSFNSLDPLRDAVLLPDFKTQLDANMPSFIVLHQRGSHFIFDDRYPPEFAVFQPICNTEPGEQGRVGKNLSKQRQCGHDQRLVNSYDNTIVFTDWFLSEVIAGLQDKNALFVYVSDHGEGVTGRIRPDTWGVWHVPMLWWASDRFIKNHPDVVATLKSKKAQPTSHSNIFHSLLDCMGAESLLIDPDLSLCHRLSQ